MPRKKKELSIDSDAEAIFQEEPKAPSRPAPTFVTEVIESGSESESDDSSDTKSVSEAVEELENLTGGETQPVKENIEVPEPKPKLQTLEAEPENSSQKQVVEELFSRKDTGLTEISVGRKKGRHSVFIWAMIVVVAAVTTGAGLLFFSGSESAKITILPQPTPTIIPTHTLAPTPTLQVTRGDITVQVLNGGGVPGAASKMKSFLAEKGYSVVDVGNTDEYSYEETAVNIKKSLASVLVTLETDLEEEYSLSSSSADIDEDASYDVQVIVGKK